MFQYAYVKALSLRNKQDFKLDISWFEQYKLHAYGLELFNIEKRYASNRDIPLYEKFSSNNKYIDYWRLYVKWLLKRLNPVHHLEKQFNFDKKFLTISGYIEGYFQSEEYFLDYEDEIRKEFTFRHPPSPENQKTINTIQITNSIGIHIRRGDYLKGNNINYHGVCSLEYYQQAIAYMRSKINNPQFFFFSDDIQWVKENLKTWNNNDIYIDWNIWDQSREDMRLMSLCKHNIIANSSFSRRGAWLNNNKEKIVVAPSKWFANKELDSSNIIPSNRIRF
jgi:hypothetical protein